MFALLLITPILVQATEHPAIFTDKESYDENDNVIIVTGENFVGLFIMAIADPNGAYAGIFQVYPIPDGSFEHQIPSVYLHENQDISQPLIDGTFTIIVSSRGELYETTFYVGSAPSQSEPVPETIPPTITLQTDTRDYYINDIVFLNGTTTNVDLSADTSISYEIRYGSEITIPADNDIILQGDGTFQFTVDTATFNDEIGSHVITVTIQNATASSSAYYHAIPDMRNETLYEIIISQNNTINNQGLDIDTRITAQDDIIDMQNDAIDTQNDIIESLQESIGMIMDFLGL